MRYMLGVLTILYAFLVSAQRPRIRDNKIIRKKMWKKETYRPQHYKYVFSSPAVKHCIQFRFTAFRISIPPVYRTYRYVCPSESKLIIIFFSPTAESRFQILFTRVYTTRLLYRVFSLVSVLTIIACGCIIQCYTNHERACVRIIVPYARWSINGKYRESHYRTGEKKIKKKKN